MCVIPEGKLGLGHNTIHQENLLINKLHPSAPIVLGLPWLRKYNPQIDWRNLTLAFKGKARLSAALTSTLGTKNQCTPSITEITDIESISNLPALGPDDPVLVKETEFQEYQAQKLKQFPKKGIHFPIAN